MGLSRMRGEVSFLCVTMHREKGRERMGCCCEGEREGVSCDMPSGDIFLTVFV